MRQWSDRVSGLIQAYRTLKSLNLDIFLPQMERKRSKEYLVIISLAAKESFERFSCLGFIFEKSKHREAGLKHKLKLKPWRLRIFRRFNTCLVNENCCLWMWFTELYFFYRFLVVSLVILIAVPFVFSRLWTSLAGVLKMPRVSNTFEDYKSIKPLNEK